MTGNEVIVVKGGKAVLGKVRHSGYDILDWLRSTPAKDLFSFTPGWLWKTYYGWRLGRMSQCGRESEIRSKFQKTGFIFSVPVRCSRTHRVLLAVAIKALGEEDNLCCSYADFRVLIDLDRRIVEVNGCEWVVQNGHFLPGLLADRAISPAEDADEPDAPPEVHAIKPSGCREAYYRNALVHIRGVIDTILAP